jgi:hypothetical protein
MPKPTYASLQLALRNLEDKAQYAKLSPKRKKLLANIAKVHANADNQAPDVVVNSMRKKRKAQVLSAVTAITGVLGSIDSRGAAALMASDWDELK